MSLSRENYHRKRAEGERRGTMGMSAWRQKTTSIPSYSTSTFHVGLPWPWRQSLSLTYPLGSKHIASISRDHRIVPYRLYHHVFSRWK